MTNAIPLHDTTNVVKFPSKQIQKICLSPYVMIEVDFYGNVRLCGCAAWMPTTIGNIRETDLVTLLSSPLATDIRRSIADGSYEYCNEQRCGIMQNNGLNEYNTLPPAIQQIVNTPSKFKYPQEIYFAGDELCNLSCPSCRPAVIKLTDDQKEKRIALGKRIKQNMFPAPSTDPIKLKMSTAGEVFASPSMLEFLSTINADDFPNLTLSLQTNGLLAERNWHKLNGLQNRVTDVTISIDAATSKTYETLRRGGKWTDLLSALDFLSKQNLELRLRMVVQQANYKEMEEFYSLAMHHNASLVEYCRIVPWPNTYSNEEFAQHDVFDPAHSEYNEAKRILEKVMSYPNTLKFGGL